MAKERRFDCVNIRTACKLGLHPDLYCKGDCKRYKKDPQFVEFPGWVQTASVPGVEVVDTKAVGLQEEIDSLKVRLEIAENRVKELESRPKEEAPVIKEIIKNKPGRKPKK